MAASDKGFEHAGVSLREKLVKAGVSNEKEIRERLAFAYAIIQSAPTINLAAFNPLETKG